MADLPQSEYKRYVAVVQNGIANPDVLNDNQFQFLTDFCARFEMYKHKTFVSEKQSLYFNVIEDHLRMHLGETYED